MRGLLYPKMLKETKTQETIVLFVTFLSLVAFQLEGARAPSAPLATPMLEAIIKLKLKTWIKLAQKIQIRPCIYVCLGS